MSDRRKENETGEVIDEQIGEQDGEFSNMWRLKGQRRGYFFNGGRDIECDMYSQGPLGIFFFFSLFFSSSSASSFLSRGGLESGRGAPESPDRKSLASCAVFGVQERQELIDAGCCCASNQISPWIARRPAFLVWCHRKPDP